jgi:Xaa-Pro aminopeptidase
LSYNHGTGHGVGSYLAVHEGPQSIHNTRAFSVPLEPGMVCSNEPGYYKDQQYGMRVENLIHVVRDDEKSNEEFEFYKFETSTVCPIDTRLVEKSLMNANQIKWLNEYHKRVYEKLAPFVQGEVKSWLQNATRAI